MVPSLGRGIARGGGGRSPPSRKRSCEVIEAGAPALPAQRFLGRGFGRGAKPASESSGGYDATHGAPPSANLRPRPAGRARRDGRERGVRRSVARGRAVLPRGL